MRMNSIDRSIDTRDICTNYSCFCKRPAVLRDETVCNVNVQRLQRKLMHDAWFIVILMSCRHWRVSSMTIINFPYNFCIISYIFLRIVKVTESFTCINQTLNSVAFYILLQGLLSFAKIEFSWLFSVVCWGIGLKVWIWICIDEIQIKFNSFCVWSFLTQVFFSLC